MDGTAGSTMSMASTLEELRGPVLHGLCCIGIAVSWCWLLALAVVHYPTPLPDVLAPPVALLLVSSFPLLSRRLPTGLRSFLVLLGMGGVPLLGHFWRPSPHWLYWQPLVIVTAGILASGAALFALAAILSSATLLCARWVPIPGGGLELALPLVLLWATAGVSWLSSRNLYSAYLWAMESQSRAWQTAEEVRVRRGELRRTLDSLLTTYGILERTTRELEAARLEAEAARNVKSRFVATISHELRTPLNVIVGFAEMIYKSPGTYGRFSWPPALREDLLTIWQNAEHLLQMVDDILDLARIEVSRLPVLPEHTDLGQLVRGALVAASGLFRASELDLRVSLPNETLLLDADPTRIRQVILNLINNAIRHTDKGFIEVGARCAESEAIIYVRDSGRGIPEDRLETIFDEFVQLDPSGRLPHGGLGLGLAISRQLVQLHGGRIWAESVLGEGSTFYVALPLPKTHPMVGIPPLRRSRAKRSPPSRQEDTVVALCTDVPVIRMLERHLEDLRVVAARSVSEAVALVQQHHPEAILVVAESPAESAVAMHTAQAMLDALGPLDVTAIVCGFPVERHAALALGVSEFLIKPVTQKPLAEAIRRVCANPRRVLIADDDADMGRLLSRMAQQEWEQVEVMVAGSGAEAISLLPQRPDVILLDLLMPVMPGIEVLKVLRSSEATASIPVIVVSAHGPTEGWAVPQKCDLRVLRRRGFTAAGMMRALQAIVKSLPARHVVGEASCS